MKLQSKRKLSGSRSRSRNQFNNLNISEMKAKVKKFKNHYLVITWPRIIKKSRGQKKSRQNLKPSNHYNPKSRRQLNSLEKKANMRIINNMYTKVSNPIKVKVDLKNNYETLRELLNKILNDYNKKKVESIFAANRNTLWHENRLKYNEPEPSGYFEFLPINDTNNILNTKLGDLQLKDYKIKTIIKNLNINIKSLKK